MRRVGALVGGAAVLSFTGYALGSQSGDGLAISKSAGQGSPTSNTAPAHFRGPGGPGGPGTRGLQQLADRLGVEPAKLEAALADIRAQQQPPAGDPRDRFAAGLASKLGIDEAKVQRVLEDLRPERGERREKFRDLSAGLAKELGVDEDKLRTALDELRKEHEAKHEERRNAFAQALADRLGIDVEKVKAALPLGGPHHGRRGP